MAKKESFLLRTDPEVLAALRRWADDELRSVNGQVDFLLRRALMDAGRLRKSGSSRSDNTLSHDRPGRGETSETGDE